MKSFPILRHAALGLLAALSLTAMAATPAAGDGYDHQGRPGAAMHGMAGAEGHHGDRMGHDRMDDHMGGLSPRMLQSLQLSEAQRAKVTELTQAQAKTMQEQMSESRARHEQLDQLSRAPGFDAAKARALADEQGQRMAQHLFQRAQLQSQLRALLTPEQLKQLDARAAEARPQDGKGPRPQSR
ncbi:MAG: hypothetical protein RLZZ22_1356 [Pseudomonadota bacterium]|jgi:Spy/CpxP family protein refolding chaperone